MVIYDLSATQRDRLNQRTVDIQPQVILRLTVKHRIGTSAGLPVYGSGYDIVEFDATSRLIGMPSITISKPRTPDANAQEARTVTLKFANPDGYFAATQDGAIIRTSDIHEGFVKIRADIGTGIPETFFYGKLDKLPTESRGITEITAISTIWEAIRKPIQYEDWGVTPNGTQTFRATSEVTATAVTVQSCGATFQALHGLATFDAMGNARPWAKKEGGGNISLLAVGISGTKQLGTYRIEFLDASNYSITFPNGNQFTAGNINQNVSIQGITINAADWDGTAEKGSAIEFKICLTLYGNPVAIAYYLTERALLNNYGTPLNTTPSVRIDQASFTVAAQRFDGMPIWFTMTNESNEVFSRKPNGKPINAAFAAQSCLDAVACTLDLSSDGLVSCRMPYIDNSPLWEATTDEHLTESITIRPTDETYNYLRVQYGFDPVAKSFIAEAVGDYRESPTQDIVEMTVTMPFTPLGWGNRHAEWLRDTIRRRHLRKQITIETEAISQFGLTLMAGDRLRLVSELPPLNTPTEVIGISKAIQGRAKLQLVAIQQPEGNPATVCTAIQGQTAIF